MSKSAERDSWDKLQSLSAIIAAVVVPVVIAVLGNDIAMAVRDAELRARYTELAIGILQSPPDSSGVDIRDWAVAIVQEYSDVPLKQRAIDELLNGAIATSLQTSARKSAQADSFLVETWVPIYARHFAHEIRMLPDFAPAMASSDTVAMEAIFQDAIEVAIDEILARHGELRGNPEAIQREVHEAIQRKYRQSPHEPERLDRTRRH